MVIKLGINGFGRIGRVIFRAGLKKTDLEIAAINDPAIDIEYICYLIKFDSTHGKFSGSVTHTKNEIFVEDSRIKVFHEKQPSSVPWQTAGVHYVIEASGMFTSLEKASGHLASDSVRRVIVTAPSVDVPMIILGVNQDELNAGPKVISCASSTLYCLAPIVKVLEDSFGVAEGFITSIHAMTPSLKPLDGLCLRGKHWRDHRGIHQNIIPATTGACKALGRIIPRVKDKLTGLAFRVPIVNVSVLDLTIRLNSNTTIHDIIKSVQKASSASLQNIIKISKDEAVSSDFIGETHSCVLDADSSLQLKPNFFKLVCWYENEYSYACRVLDSIFCSEKHAQLILPTKIEISRNTHLQKQDVVQQTDSSKKEVRFSASQDTGLHSKPLQTQLIIRKPNSTHISGNTQALHNKDTKKKTEIFKIWNEETKIRQPIPRHNRNAFFHSCVTVKSQNREDIECKKAHERLDMLKQEFSKMVNITESLLKKSYISNFHPKSKNIASSKTEVRKSGNDIDVEETNQSCDTFSENYENLQKDSPIFDSGDSNTSSRNIDILRKNGEIHSKDEHNSNFAINQPINNHCDVKNKISIFENALDNKPISNDEEITTSSVDISPACKVENKVLQKAMKSCDNKKDNEEQKLDPNIKMNSISQRNKFQCCIMKNDSKNNQFFNPSSKVAMLSDEKVTPAWKSRNMSNDARFLSLFKKNSEAELIHNTKVNKNLAIPVINDENPSMETKLSDCVLTENVVVKSDKNTNDILIKLKNSDINNVSIEEESPVKLSDETQDTPKDNNNDNVEEPTENTMKNETRLYCTEQNLTESDTSKCSNLDIEDNAVSNVKVNQHKPDIYDKLDSISGTDSNNSFQINERKSQIINITDLTNSLEDLARLDKICKIIEISDELSNKLFSALDYADGIDIKKKKWSFKDLCEKIKFDDFCEKVFGKSSG